MISKIVILIMKYDEAYIITQYKTGRTAKEIGKELGTYNTTIRRILIRNKVKLRGISETLQVVKSNPFSSSDTYWFGLLATDGCITNGYIILELQAKDLDLIKQYAEKVNAKILTTVHTSGSVLYRVQFKNKESVAYLESLGIVPRKSKTLCMRIPLDWNFLRGAYDGDGTFHNGFTIYTSSACFKEQLLLFLRHNDFRPTSRLNNNIFSVNIYGVNQIRRLHNLLYESRGVYLTRKRDKMVRFLRKMEGNTRLKRGKASTPNPVLAVDR